MDFPELPGYEITGVLGQGAMGCVYRGRHRQDGQEVAIKTLLVEDPSMQRALSNEWEVLCRVEHPYLVNEREILESNDHTYLVMEFVESVPLTQWIETHSREQRMQLGGPILDKMCQVLLYLHSQDPPVIVRDLKPDNVLVLPNGDIKLIDFGIARALVGDSKTEVALKGFASAAYAPLEQYSAQSTTSVASDVYSLGATAYHMISGNLPISAIDMLTAGQQPEKMLLDMGVEPGWASLIAAAMRPKAPHRISLEDFRRRIPGMHKPTEVATPAPPRVVRGVAPTQDTNAKWLWALLVVSLLLVIAMLIPGD
jgi:serine/threonine-protein kinase